MRIWSLHPKHLDSRGLVALWREALLAQAVLAGKTTGYRKHPQLERFREHRKPLEAIGAYLHKVREEAVKRGYKFDGKRIVSKPKGKIRIKVTDGQLRYEWLHLKRKLKARDGKWLEGQAGKKVEQHPIFSIRKGKAEAWEKIKINKK